MTTHPLAAPASAAPTRRTEAAPGPATAAPATAEPTATQPTTTQPTATHHSAAFTRAAAAAAPALLLGYGLVRQFSHHHAPGSAWTFGHSLFLLALAAFVPVLLDLRRRATPGPLRETVHALAQAGLLCLAVQIVIDLYVAAVSADRSAMDVHYGRIDALPGLQPAVYSLGPALFYLGLAAAAALAAYRRTEPRQSAARPPRWTPPLLLLGCLVPAATLDLLPVAALLLAVALSPLTRRAPQRI